MEGTIKELENSEIEITGSISADKFNLYWPKALKAFNDKMELPGFRKGHIPEKVVLENAGEMGILEEAAEMALGDLYPEFIVKNNIKAISRPSISITKIAKNNPLEFKIKTAVMPAVELPDFKAIAKKVNETVKKEEIKVEEKEIDAVIEDIRKSRAKKNETHKCEDENCKDKHKDVKNSEKEEKTELPEVNDEFAKSLGNFKNLEELRNKIKENMTNEKTGQRKEKGRTEILEKIAEKMKISLPEIMVKREIDQMMSEIKQKIEQMGIPFEKYIAQINKKEEDIRKESRGVAEKRVRSKLILKKIADEEKIKPAGKDVEDEIKILMEYYKGADPLQTRMYVEDILTNEKVFEFLESQV